MPPIEPCRKCGAIDQPPTPWARSLCAFCGCSMKMRGGSRGAQTASPENKRATSYMARNQSRRKATYAKD